MAGGTRPTPGPYRTAGACATKSTHICGRSIRKPAGYRRGRGKRTLNSGPENGVQLIIVDLIGIFEMHAGRAGGRRRVRGISNIEWSARLFHYIALRIGRIGENAV